jgi:hypothetical protein
MTHSKLPRWLLAGLFLLMLHGTAHAQATRTWVSGVGDDANPCSRTAPCKTFPGAISKTAANGEIDCLDPGSFGVVTITKSITIDCNGVAGGILNSSTTGVVVNAGASDVIVLRNLAIQGGGTGMFGIKFLAGSALHLENVVISGQNYSTSGTPWGIWFNPTAGAPKLFMDNVKVIDNGYNDLGGGIYLQPVSPATVTAQITRSQIADNQGSAGIRHDNRTFVNISDSSITGNYQQGAMVVAAAAPADLTLSNVLVSGNGVSATTSGAGVQTQGAVAAAHITGCTVTDNEVGLRVLTSGVIVSYGDNHVYGNTTNGAPTSTIAGM